MNKRNRWLGLMIIAILAVMLAACTSPQAAAPPVTGQAADGGAPSSTATDGGAPVLFQYSTINALMGGRYEGDLTLGELLQHGSFGVGTVNALDGEMVVLDGQFFQITGDGQLHQLPDDTKTPFAVVTDFQSQQTLTIGSVDTFEDLERLLTEEFWHRNNFYAVRIDGDFRYIKARSVPRQVRPYPPLSAVTADQPTFEFEDVNGTMVGFWSPDYVEGINVPGFHLHFVTADQTSGGHVLGVAVQSATVELATLADFQVSMPQGEEFAEADLTTFSGQDIAAVESER